MILEKIISGGQTGADRAALDFAIDNGLFHGGWVPRGRLAEDGVIPDRYQVRETSSSVYAERTGKNVLEADGTLIFSHGPLTGGSELTRQIADRNGRHCLHADLDGMDEFHVAFEIMHWLRHHGIKVLNVAGPRASKDPGIYPAVFQILEAVYYFLLMEESMPDFINRPVDSLETADRREIPASLTDAVTRLAADLPLKEKVVMAGLSASEFFSRHGALELYIRNYFGLDAGNMRLLTSCRKASGRPDMGIDDAVALILNHFQEFLKETHAIRLVKS